jgi:glucosamine 6-phosphate synthetase-like amidotransferase/phosphosugar isomerase protein
MCGIVGMSLRRDVKSRDYNIPKLKNLFTEMLVEAQVRGSAATGIVVTTWEDKKDKPKIYVLRSPTPAKEFVQTDDYKRILDKVDNHCLSLIGHTRAASGSGSPAVDNNNNHPFIHGPIIGVHNGLVVNDAKLWKEYSGYMKPKGKCDSEVIFAAIDTFIRSGQYSNKVEAIRGALAKVDGWYAIAMVDAKEPGKVYIAKDSRSPLTLGWWAYAEVAVFASDWDYVTKAYRRADTVTGTHFPIDRHDFKSNELVVLDSVQTGRPYAEFYVGKHNLNVDEKKLSKIIEENQEAFNTTQGR